MSADNYLPYASIDLLVGNGDAALTIMYRGIRFHIRFKAGDLRGSQSGTDSSSLELHFQHLQKALDDEPNGMESLEDWLVEPCISYIRQLASTDLSAHTLSLLGYFDPVTYAFRLANVGGRLQATPESSEFLSKRRWVSTVPKSEPVVFSALQHGVACIPASRLEILRPTIRCEQDRYSFPRKVRSVDSGRSYFFKAASDQKSFLRELDATRRIQMNTAGRGLRVSRLAGLVKWENDESILGLLIEYIDNQETLYYQVSRGASDIDRQKWGAQILDTVKGLHAIGIVWGDVKPDNVILDLEGNAWVIDFGGGFTRGWVDEKHQDTKEGDLEGLSKISQFLG